MRRSTRKKIPVIATTSSRQEDHKRTTRQAVVPSNQETLEERSVHDADEEEEDDEGDSSSSKGPPAPRFQVGQRVLARDSDGLLYTAFVRRAEYGYLHQWQFGILGTMDSSLDEDGGNNFMEEMQSTFSQQQHWTYFLHFDGWKVNWDRWLYEQDVLEYSEEHMAWQKRIQTEHRALLKEHKTQGKKVDGAGFLKAWKPKLESVMDELQGIKKKRVGPPKKKRKVADVDDLRKQEQVLRKQHLISRPTTDREQIQLPSGLKRVLVEDWELIMGAFGMVHNLEPKVSVRQVLHQYIQSKGVTLASQEEHVIPKTDAQSEIAETTDMDISDEVRKDAKREESSAPNADVNIDEEEESRKKLQKEWTDMANGICQLFDQAFPVRLLFPREQAQFHALLEASKEEDAKGEVPSFRSPSDHYGAAHLLRLYCQLPALLAEYYDGANEELQQVVVKPILAKMNDLLRFLQSHQELYFPQNFRKLTLDEEKLQQKWVKRYEKRKAATTQPVEGTNDEVA